MTAEPIVIVVGSGKGGVGKSLVSVMLGLALAREGHRTLLFDGDQHLGNLHVMLGIRPRARREAVLQVPVAPSELVQPVADNLFLLPADSGAETYAELDPLDRARLELRLQGLYDRFDVVVVDAGAGLDSVMQASTVRTTHLLVVTAPEPAALTDAYALLKIMHGRQPQLAMDVLVNRVIDDHEGDHAFAKLAAACERFLRRAVREPLHCLALLAESDAFRLVHDTVIPRLDLPTLVRSSA